MILRLAVWISIYAVSFTISSCGKKNSDSLNRLSKASSPYLREHSDNPVDWYEWGDEALEKAKKENKPLIISIGYASCHWCHVMEEESFMDTVVARLMNENFVSIKVDREERPDIDQVYIDAAQLLTGHAGWPLNAFALPDGKPFYAGTYFTNQQWTTLLTQVVHAYKDQNGTLVKQSDQVIQGIASNDAITPLAQNQNQDFVKTYKTIFTNWEPYLDYQTGGLQGAPKFPMPVIGEYLLQEYYLNKNEKALNAILVTLDEMAKGGIYDHLRGGFARYSTDAEWKVPHFEKMLYDNGQLVSLYAHAYQVTKNQTYATVVDETLEFIKQELTSDDGGFYSSLNADSEGEEGTFYVWTKAEIDNLLDKKSAALFGDYFNVTDKGNWEHQKNVLHTKISLEELATQQAISPEDARKILTDAKKIILTARNKRIHPSLDNKILTSWNALMLAGYIDAYWAFEKKEYLEIALKNAEFLQKNMVHEDGRLWRSYSNSKPSIEAFLDDYALVALAYIKLYQATFDIQWLEQARTITEYSVTHFQDNKSGLFFYTSDLADHLIAKKIEIPDQVIPSSNAAMAEALFKLSHYFEIQSYDSLAVGMVNQVANTIAQNGPYYAKWASVMGMITFQPFEVAVMGNEASENTKQLMMHYLPTALLMGGQKENLPLLENKFIADKTIIYVCRDKVCKLPVTEVDKALEQLNTK